MGAMGRPDVGGMAAVGFGVLVAAIGLVIAISKASQKKDNQTASTKKFRFVLKRFNRKQKFVGIATMRWKLNFRLHN